MGRTSRISYHAHESVTLQECSRFLAGNIIRSRARNAKLDIRGVFGSVCRHEYPVLFMDMKHGERYVKKRSRVDDKYKVIAIMLNVTFLRMKGDVSCD